jgi:hypothetical protein
MADLALTFGGDLSIGPAGELLLSANDIATQQRVLRRLLTNPGDYLWQLNYGAGLAQYVGQPGALSAIAGIARMQMLLEAAVAPTPPPVIGSQAGDDGVVTLTITYADAASKQSFLIVSPL